MTARSHVAAPEGYELLVMRNGGVVDAFSVVAFHLVGDHLDGVITPTGEKLDAFSIKSALLLPDGRVHAYCEMFANQSAWETACRRRGAR